MLTLKMYNFFDALKNILSLYNGFHNDKIPQYCFSRSLSSVFNKAIINVK